MAPNTYKLALLLTSISSALAGSFVAAVQPTVVLKPQGVNLAPRYTNTSNFTYKGCYADNNANHRTVYASTPASYTDPNGMTIETCAAFCARYQFFGLEYSQECYCGNTLNPADAKLAETECKMPCKGNSAEKCGAGSVMSVYTNNLYVPAGPIPGATYLGCFLDSGNPHPLDNNVISTMNMTPAKCKANCAGFEYFGLEYGQECYCGNTVPPTPKPESDCSLPCSGDNRYTCGDGNRLTVYIQASPPATVDPGYNYQGCYSDDPNDRTLTGKHGYEPTMDAAFCANFCKNYAYFGMEQGNECYCGSSLAGTNTPLAAGECSYTCSGHSTQLCGAPNRLTLYKNSANTARPGPVTTASSFTYKGCYSTSGSAISDAGSKSYSDTMHVEECAAHCSAFGFTYFGVEDTNVCYCGNAITSASVSATGCSYVCVGDKNEICGASAAQSVYQLTQ